MPIDRLLYDRQATDRWDDSKALSGLRGLNPVRFGYFRRVLTRTLGRDPVRMFIKPADLLEAFGRYSLQPEPPVGIKMVGNPLRLFGKMRPFKRGLIPATDVTMGSFGESPDLRIS